MRKATYIAVLGGYGDVTHSFQIARRFVRDLNIDLKFIAAHPTKGKDIQKYPGITYKWAAYDENNVLKFLTTRLLFEIKSFFHNIFTKNAMFYYERHRALGFSTYLASKITKVPFFLEVNGIIELDFEVDKNNSPLITWLNKINLNFQTIFMKSANLLFTPTQGIKNIIASQYGINPKKIKVVPNGADSEIFYPMNKKDMRKQLNLPQDKKIVIFVGGFKKWHGIKTIIESIPIVIKNDKNVLFLLVGDSKNPALMNDLKQKIKKLDIEKNIVLTGKVEYKKVPKYINSSDLAICYVSGHKRNVKQTFTALKMMEYMACEKAMIVTTPCAVDVKIKETEAGEVINPDDANALASGILKLLFNNELRKKYAKNAFSLSKKYYTWNISAKKTENAILKEIN